MAFVKHKPLLRQGFDWQKFVLPLQKVPLNPLEQTHWNDAALVTIHVPLLHGDDKQGFETLVKKVKH